MTTPLSFELGECQRCLAGVSDLTPVPPPALFAGMEVGLGEGSDIVNGDFALLVPEALFDHSDVDFEDLDDFFTVQLRVVETDVDTRGKGFIKVTNSICGQEENPGVVLKNSKKH